MKSSEPNVVGRVEVGSLKVSLTSERGRELSIRLFEQPSIQDSEAVAALFTRVIGLVDELESGETYLEELHVGDSVFRFVLAHNDESDVYTAVVR